MSDTTETIERPGGEPPGSTPLAPLTLARLKDWVIAAQPGARLPYAQGSAIVANCCRTELREKVYELAKRDFLSPHFIRGRDGLPDRHILIRSQRRCAKGEVL